MTFSRHYLAQRATLDAVDLAEVQSCRRAHNQLGFAYQVGFVRLLNRFPKQEPFEVLDELLLFTGMQLGVDSTLIEDYRRRRQTISEHQQRIARYRGLCHFGAEERRRLEAFVFERPRAWSRRLPSINAPRSSSRSNESCARARPPLVASWANRANRHGTTSLTVWRRACLARWRAISIRSSS